MERQLDHDLREVHRHLLEMGRAAEAMLTDAVHTVSTRNLDAAADVASRDVAVDQLERRIDGMCHGILVRYQTAAVDHRLVTAVLKTTGELERIGDCAKNIALAVRALGPNGGLPPGIDLEGLGRLARGMVSDALASFVEKDEALAYQVLRRDDEVDRIHVLIIERLEERMTADPAHVRPGLRLLAISRNLERIADHATNVAENVIYYLRGRDVRHGAHDPVRDAGTPAGRGATELPAGYTADGDA